MMLQLQVRCDVCGVLFARPDDQLSQLRSVRVLATQAGWQYRDMSGWDVCPPCQQDKIPSLPKEKS